jgi:hypothetical protein
MYKERTLRKRLQSITILVIRVGDNGVLRESAPCRHCAIAIKKIGIKRIKYSNNKGQIISMRTRDITIDSHPHSSGYRDHLRELDIT